jgi:hypothetical protein
VVSNSVFASNRIGVHNGGTVFTRGNNINTGNLLPEGGSGEKFTIAY